MISFTKTFSLIAVAIGVAALPQGGQSHDSCDKAIASLASNADANKCLAIPQLTQIFADPNRSIVGPLDSWLTALCSAQQCQGSTVTGVLTSSIQMCPEEASWFAIHPGQSVDADAVSQKYYPVTAKALCLKQGNTFCVTQTLTNYEKATGTLTYERLQQFIESDTTPASISSSVLCTDCNKAFHNVYVQFLGPNPTSIEENKKLCGDSFVDGQNPPGISGV